MAISNGEGESKIENSGSNKEKLAEYLHNKSPLSSLRTYHGDMAEFIKEKNESVISIATKEKERRDEKRSKEEKLGTVMPTQRKKQSKDGFQINFTILLSSLVLIAGGAVTFFYVFDAVIRAPQGKVEIKEEIIPYNNSVTLANTTPSSLGSELSKLPPSNGISIIKISDTNGKTVGNAKDFFNFMKIAPPATLWRTMGSKYAIGITYNDELVKTLLIKYYRFGQTQLRDSFATGWVKSGKFFHYLHGDNIILTIEKQKSLDASIYSELIGERLYLHAKITRK
jgi:hypothetical protein